MLQFRLQTELSVLVQLSGSSYQVFDNQTPDNCL
jgi:hypothetical protein